jgi:hypothetical protein
MKRILLFITLLGVIAGFEACQTAKTSTSAKMLKFNLENGKGYDYEMTVNMDQEIMGQPIKMDMTTYYSMDVKADEGGIKTIVSSFERFRMNTEMAGMNIKIDTDQPIAADSSTGEKNPLQAVQKMFGAIRGQKFTLKVNPEGQIMEVTGFENMAENIADSLDLDEKEREEMLQGFKGQFSQSEMKQSLERFWYIFPNKEVKVGDSWVKNTESGGKMPAKYRSTYTVKEIEGDMVTLDETSKIESKENEEIAMTGEITGTIVVDSRSGLVVSANQDMNMKATTKGMSIDIKGKSRLKGVAR